MTCLLSIVNSRHPYSVKISCDFGIKEVWFDLPKPLLDSIIHIAYAGRPENRMTLPKALVRCLAAPFISAILPRLFLTVFRYSQPLLIRQTIQFVGQPRTNEQISIRGYWIVMIAITIYLGMAVSSSRRSLRNFYATLTSFSCQHARF